MPAPAHPPRSARLASRLGCHQRGVAQPGSAPALGAGGPRFKSGRPDWIGRAKVAPGLARVGGPHYSRCRAPVAQWTERRTSNPMVAGSNPAGGAGNRWKSPSHIGRIRLVAKAAPSGSEHAVESALTAVHRRSNAGRVGVHGPGECDGLALHHGTPTQRRPPPSGSARADIAASGTRPTGSAIATTAARRPSNQSSGTIQSTHQPS